MGFYEILSLACLIQSVLLVAIGGFRAHKRYMKELESIDSDGEKSHRSIFTPFQVFLIWFFFAVVTLYLPLYRLDLANDAIVLRGIKTLLLSVQNGLRTFILDGDFYCFISFCGNPDLVNRTLGQVYNMYTAVMFVTAPFLTAGFVLSFFKNISALMKYTLSFNDEICYISELNEVSLALATNILTEKRTDDTFYLDEDGSIRGLPEISDGETAKLVREMINTESAESAPALAEPKGFFAKLGARAENFLRTKFGTGKPLIVFFSVYEDEEEGKNELLERAKSLRCICFGNDITDIGLKRRAGIKRKFYFTGTKAEENINQAIAMINHCRSSDGGAYNTADTEFYIFSVSQESEALLDMVDNGNMKVRRVNEKKNLVLNTVIDYPIFENAKKMPDGTQRMTALIIGMGSYGTELMKTLCWCGQFPEYKLSLHVADKKSDILSSLRHTSPELIETRANGGAILSEEEPYYEIYEHTGIDVSDDSLDKLLSGIELPSNVFVTLGTDEANVEVSMRVRSILRRRVNKEGGEHPKVYTVVYSNVKTDTFGNGLKVVGKDDYDITFIGGMKTRYSLKVIEQDMLDRMGMRVHLGWTLRSVNRCIESFAAARKALSADPANEQLKAAFEKENKLLKNSIDGIPGDEARYRKYEYFRRASVASVVHMLVMKKMGIEFSDKKAAQLLEHKRWCAFMRCEGYVKQSEGGRDYVARTHHDLRLFSELSPDDQIKDSIEVYRYIKMSDSSASDSAAE